MTLAPFIAQSFVIELAAGRRDVGQVACYLEWYDGINLRTSLDRTKAYKFDSARMAQRMAQKVNREYPVKFKWSVVPACF